MKKIITFICALLLISCTLIPTKLAAPYYSAIPLNEVGTYEGYTLGLGNTAAHNLEAPKIKAINNKIVMVSVGASVQNQISERFEQRIPELNNPQFRFVNLCQPAKDLSDWISDSAVWVEASNKLTSASILKEEVQVIWLQDDLILTDTAYFPSWSYRVADSIESLIVKLKTEFPKVKQVFISGRPYTGFSADFKHAEPKGYYNGWSCRFVVEDQLLGLIPVKPWISDEIYFWSSGTTPRLDGFQVLQSDFKPDGLHLSAAGKTKLGDYLFEQFKNNTVSSKYFY
jgi:hypothetical protein